MDKLQDNATIVSVSHDVGVSTDAVCVLDEMEDVALMPGRGLAALNVDASAIASHRIASGRRGLGLRVTKALFLMAVPVSATYFAGMRECRNSPAYDLHACCTGFCLRFISVIFMGHLGACGCCIHTCIRAPLTNVHVIWPQERKN